MITVSVLYTSPMFWSIIYIWIITYSLTKECCRRVNISYPDSIEALAGLGTAGITVLALHSTEHIVVYLISHSLSCNDLVQHSGLSSHQYLVFTCLHQPECWTTPTRVQQAKIRDSNPILKALPNCQEIYRYTIINTIINYNISKLFNLFFACECIFDKCNKL